MSRRDEERNDKGRWVDPVWLEEEKRHKRFNTWFHIVTGITLVGILLYGACRERERDKEIERMRNEKMIR